MINSETISTHCFLKTFSVKIVLQLVPAVYGGTWRDESGYAETPELVCQKAVRVLPQHYWNSDLLWKKHGFAKLPPTHAESIKGGQTFEVKKYFY